MTTSRLARNLFTALTIATIAAYTVAYVATFAWVTATAKEDQ